MISSFMRGLGFINRALEKFEYGVSMATMALTTLITMMQVVTRYVFNHPLTWPEEFATLLLVWMTFAGSSVLLKHRKHVDIDFFTNYLPLRWQKGLDLFVYALMFGFCLVMAWGAYKLQAFQSRHYTVALRIPKNFFSLPVLIAGVSMCLYIVFAFIKGLTELLGPEPGKKE
jgi:TRAP-type C4-dicarboxylate transport system permease small subunit